MKNVLLFSIIAGISRLLFAQNGSLYDVHLRSGTVIRGNIMELSSEKVKVELGENVISEFSMSEVEKVVPPETASAAEKKERTPYVRKKGFFNDTEFRFMLGSGNGDDKFNTAISFQTASGYKVNRYFRVGGGAGIDHYTDYSNTFVALFGRIAGDMLPHWITPVYFLDEGYGFMVKKDDAGTGAETNDSKGGWMLHAGIGVKFYTASKASFTFLTGCKVQKSQRDYQFANYDYGYHEERTYSRMTFGIGVGF